MLWLRLWLVLCLFVSVTMDSKMKHREIMLLGNVGLPTRPKPVSPPHVPSILWKLFNQRMGPSTAKKNANLCFVEDFNVPGSTVRAFSDQGRFVNPHSTNPTTTVCLEKRLFFNISIMEKEERVTMGRLEVRFGKNTYYGRLFDLRLYRITQLSLKGIGNQKTSRKLLTAQTFRLLHKSLYFNLTETCQSWQDPRKNLGLTLEISPRKEGSLLAGQLDECQGIQTFLYTSLLAVTLDSAQCTMSRAKRSHGRLKFLPSNTCKRRRLYVEFGDVGWQKWVIAPRGYFANYCQGECPYPLTDVLNGSNHAILQTLAHSFEPNDVPPPCCIPIKMAPISVLFYDNVDNVVLKHYENMSVDECGCR